MLDGQQSIPLREIDVCSGYGFAIFTCMVSVSTVSWGLWISYGMTSDQGTYFAVKEIWDEPITIESNNHIIYQTI